MDVDSGGAWIEVGMRVGGWYGRRQTVEVVAWEGTCVIILRGMRQ